MAVTLRDVAQRCGVSMATVSKVFRSYPDVSQDTRELVLSTARELGYARRGMQRALQGTLRYLLGVVDEQPEDDGLLAGFRQEAEARGWDVVLMGRDPARLGMTLLEHAQFRQVDGVAILRTDFYAPGVAELIGSRLPCVSVEHPFSNRPCVVSEIAEGTEALVEYAAEMGKRRIAIVLGQAGTVTEKRLAGFYRGMKRQRLECPPIYVVQGEDRNAAAAKQAVERLMQLPQPPECILLPDDVSCLGAIAAARLLDLRVPEDLSLAGYGGDRLLQLLPRPLTTIDRDAFSMGKKAAQLLLESIESPKTFLGEAVCMPCRLLPGMTVGGQGGWKR